MMRKKCAESVKLIKVETFSTATTPSTHIALSFSTTTMWKLLLSLSSLPFCAPLLSLAHSLSLSLPTLQRGAQSDRCNAAVEAWAELAGCRGQTRASSSDWREQRRGDGSGGGSRNKTVVAVVVSVVAVQLQRRLCLGIWLCWSGRTSPCEFNMDPDTSTHPEAQHGEWDLKGGRKRWEMRRVILSKKLKSMLVNKGVRSHGFPVSLLLWLGSPFGSQAVD